MDHPAKLFLEDLREGMRFTAGPLRVEAEEVNAFATRYDPQPFHLDEAAAQDNPVRGPCCERVAHSGYDHAPRHRGAALRGRCDRGGRRDPVAATNPTR